MIFFFLNQASAMRVKYLKKLFITLCDSCAVVLVHLGGSFAKGCCSAGAAWGLE